MEKQIKDSIYINLGINSYQEFISKRGNKPAIFVGQLIDALFEYGNGPKAIQVLGRSPQSFNRNIKKLFPNVKLQGGGQTWKHWLVTQSDYKFCSYCKSYKLKTEFNNTKGNYDGLDGRCRVCANESNSNYYNANKDYFRQYEEDHILEYRARTAKRRAAKLNRTPVWADSEEIKRIYSECPEGYHVDHIIPLQGKLVSGLHVENNLQYLTEKENLSKGNKF